MDLVQIVSTSEPPVAKILDYGKFRFQEQKKKAEARKRQKVVELKEIKLRPNIDVHDYEVKAKAMHRFFDEGDKVKVTLRFRGREMAQLSIGDNGAMAAVTGPLAEIERIVARTPGYVVVANINSNTQAVIGGATTAVEAADDWNTYVTVHAYNARSVRRSVEAGVKVIEHGQLLDEATVKLLGDKGIFLSLQALDPAPPWAPRGQW